VIKDSKLSTLNDTYRWDIQGLRAIAVLAVVIFHINPQLLPGGYIGVDIFFVISGYLIMGFIWRDLNKESFSLVTFYVKRVYRLFPALFVMLLLSAVAAYFILLSDESVDFVHSFISTLFYISNFYFYLEVDYFNEAMKFSPLLHTWSLSVEEQFYIIFPIILLLVYKRVNEWLFPILVALAILSLLLSELSIHWDESFAFYASPTRFFQFILGGVVAIYLQKYTLSQTLNNLIATVGFVLIILPMFLYTEKTLFPGLHALVPSFGTALILFSGLQRGHTTLFLSNSVFKLIGNASYSIYLWHWPLIVFYKLEVSPSLSSLEQITLFSASILFGYLSWRYIENSTRLAYKRSDGLKVIYFTIGSSTVVSLLAFYSFSGVSYRSLESQSKASQYLDYKADNFRAGECFLTSQYDNVDFFDKNKCITHSNGKKNYLLVGDSHAAHFYSALAKVIKEDETLSQVTASGCHPTLPYSGTKRCSSLVKWAYEELIKEKHFDTIILSAHWAYADKQSLLSAIKLLLNYTDKIIVLGPNMEYLQPLPRLLVKAPEGEDTKMIYKRAGNYKAVASVDYHMKKYLDVEKVKYISILRVLCSQDGCRTTARDGTPITFDSGHFTHEGAYYVVKQIEKRLFDR